jgi:hypothetical protein
MDTSRYKLFQGIRNDMFELEGIVKEIRRTEGLLRDLKSGSRGDHKVVMDSVELPHDMAKLAKALMIRELSGRLEGLYQNYIKVRNSQKFQSINDDDVASLHVDEFI